MIEKSRMEELNKYMVSEQNPADYYKNQINWENGFIVGSYWATYNTYKGSERYTYNDKSGGWKFHIHADIDEGLEGDGSSHAYAHQHVEGAP